jgi:mono/diheme cytochrome c family protein
MLTNALIWLAVIGLTLAIVWLTLRARRASRPVSKWVGILGGGLFSLILLLVSGVSTRGMFLLYSPRGRPVREMTVEKTPERIARGQHIANAWCAACHTLNGQLPLSGGKNLSDEAGMPLGDLYTINLTPAGPLATWTDGEIFRAIRDGADNKRRRLPVMSAQRVRNLSDDDIKAVIAYLRSQPPVQHETPPVRPSFLTVAFAGAGMLPLLPDMAPDSIVAPPHGANKEYGRYVVKWMGCDECHGPQLTGGGGGVLPKGPSLRSVKGWTRDGFIAAMRTGKTPFGTQLDSLQMPWNFVGRLTDDELTAMHAYLVTLP